MGLGADNENKQWRINVHAKKRRSLDLRITASGSPATFLSKLRNLSVLLRVRGFILKVKATTAPGDNRHHRHGVFKSMFRRFTEKIRRHPPAAMPETLPTLSRLKQIAHQVMSANLKSFDLCWLSSTRQDPIGIGCLFLAVFGIGISAGICLRETTIGGAFILMPILLIRYSVMQRYKNKALTSLMNLSIFLFILGSAHPRSVFENYLWKVVKMLRLTF